LRKKFNIDVKGQVVSAKVECSFEIHNGMAFIPPVKGASSEYMSQRNMTIQPKSINVLA
jgi:hypothetical protein